MRTFCKVVHASSLRVIGQALEVADVRVFELEKHGQYYVVWSDSLANAEKWTSDWALTTDCYAAGARQNKANCSLCFSRSDIIRLDNKASKRRRSASSYTKGNKLPQLLRTVGEHLDRSAVGAFRLSWTPEDARVSILPTNDLVIEKITFTHEKLRQLSLHTRFRRSKKHGLQLIHVK